MWHSLSRQLHIHLLQDIKVPHRYHTSGKQAIDNQSRAALHVQGTKHFYAFNIEQTFGDMTSCNNQYPLNFPSSFSAPLQNPSNASLT
jgi:hypothetical protein